MENIPKATHPVIQLVKAYLLILFFAAFFMGISIVNTAHQPGDQTPLLIYIYALIIVPSLGGVISLYLLIIEKDKNRRLGNVGNCCRSFGVYLAEFDSP